MDCEKFENLLIDELYGELDEVTSAAVRRHAAGCARCGALLSGLRATRKVAALPVEEPPADLEDRILSAVREQQKVLPMRARFAMALSRAGAWAMRPQTAMAAVFLVVIGTSFVLVQSRNKSAPASAVNAEGAPVATEPYRGAPTAAASALALEGNESAFAHGIAEKKELALATPAATATAAADEQNAPVDDSAKDKLGNEKFRERAIANAAPIGGANGLDQDGLASTATVARGGGGAATGASAHDARVAVAEAAPRAQGQGAAPPAPPAGDPAAALAAGRNEKAKNGCTQTAIQSFESARARASGSAIGNDATLEAAACYEALGNTQLARARYAELAGKSGYAALAQEGLARLTPVAARKAAPAHMQAAPVQPAQIQQKADSY